MLVKRHIKGSITLVAWKVARKHAQAGQLGTFFLFVRPAHRRSHGVARGALCQSYGPYALTGPICKFEICNEVQSYYSWWHSSRRLFIIGPYISSHVKCISIKKKSMKISIGDIKRNNNSQAWNKSERPAYSSGIEICRSPVLEVAGPVRGFFFVKTG